MYEMSDIMKKILLKDYSMLLIGHEIRRGKLKKV